MEEKPSKADYFNKVESLLKDKNRVALFTHFCPDPDAIGSMMGMEFLCNKLGKGTSLFYTGPISHPQNRAFVNLLDPDLKDISEYKDSDYDIRVLLDCIPAHAGLNGVKINFDLVLDHHKENTNGHKAYVVNVKSGSACGLVYDLIKKYGFTLDADNDYDSRVATALLIGMSTDTENLMAEDTTEYEFDAWRELFPIRDPVILRQIINFEKPKFWIDGEAEAVRLVKIEDGIGVVGLGIVPSKHRDMIADMAQGMVSWEDIHTAVAFAVVDGDRIEGSVRTNNPTMSVPDLCEALGGKYGTGGGKRGGKGAYRYELAGASIEEDEDDQTKSLTWELLNKKETNRIFRLIRNK